MRRLFVSVVFVLLGATLVASAGALGGVSKRKRDLSAFNSYSVRFQPGTSTAQMVPAITAAGGGAVADIHQIRAMAAASLDPHFGDTLAAPPIVTASFLDSR